MRRHRTYSRSSKSSAGIALAAVGILVLLGNVEWALAQLGNGLCAAAGDALGILPCLVLAACQALPAYVLGQHAVLGWLLHMLLALWPLLPTGGGTI